MPQPAPRDPMLQWAESLSPEEEQALRNEALRGLNATTLKLFDGKTLATSRTLRMRAWEHQRKLNAFENGRL